MKKNPYWVPPWWARGFTWHATYVSTVWVKKKATNEFCRLKFSKIQISNFKFQISNFNWPGLGRDGSDGRNGTAVPQPWPIEI